MNQTENYSLNKPEYTDNVDIAKLNENADIIDAKLKEHSDALELAALGIKYRGTVDYYADLPLDAEIGDAYTVKYSGDSGTTPDGTEYVWGNVGGSEQWIDFSKDSYTKAEVDALLAGLQTILSATNKLNPAYINYDSTHRAVSDTEKSTWNSKQNALSSTQLDAVNSGIDSTKVDQIETNKNNISAITLSSTVVTGNLDNVTSNEFKVYTNSSLNLPSIDYCFVRTSVYSATGALQEAFVIATGVSYVRTKTLGNWTNWLQITNT